MNPLDRLLNAVRPYGEVILLSILLVAAVWLRLSLPDLIRMRRIQAWITLGPDVWPRMLIDLAILCLIGLLLIALVDLRRNLAAGASKEGASVRDIGRWFAIITIICLYIWFLPTGGFILTTFLFGVSYCIVAGLRRPREMLGIPAVFLVASYLLFTQLLSVPLPRGVGILRQLSFHIY